MFPKFVLPIDAAVVPPPALIFVGVSVKFAAALMRTVLREVCRISQNKCQCEFHFRSFNPSTVDCWQWSNQQA